MGDNDNDQCALKEQCAINEERRAKKKYTRTLTCKLCLRDWHAYCSGYHTKSDNELSNIAKVFVCERCHYFTNTVADMVYDKVNTIIQALKTELSANNSLISDKLQYIEEKISRANDNSFFANQKASNKNSESISSQDQTCALLNDTNTSASVVATTVNIDERVASNTNKIVDTDKDKILTYYLCGIECELAFDDIKFILEDEGLSVNNIDVEFPEGNFRKKRFIVLTSKSNRTLFAFKRAFDKCSLVGTWFLRSTPPKSNVHKINTDHSNNAFHESKHNTAHDSFRVKNTRATYKTRQNIENKSSIQNSYTNKNSNFSRQKRNTPPINLYKNTPLTNVPSNNYWQRNVTNAVSNLNDNSSQITSNESMVPFLEKLLVLARQT